MSFESDLKKAQRELETKISKIFRLSVTKGFQQVILNSVVDTGRFRANWQPSLNTPISSVLFQGVAVQSGTRSITYEADVASFINSATLNDSFYLSNNISYAQYLKDNPEPKWIEIEMAKLPDYVREYTRVVDK